MKVLKIFRLILVTVFLVQLASCLNSRDNEIRKGPNPDPNPNPNNFRTRFPINFQKAQNSKSKAGVKILESLTRSSSNILARNPSIHGNPGSPGVRQDTKTSDLSNIPKVRADYDDNEFLDSESDEIDANSGGSYSPMPVYQNTPKPVAPTGLGMPGNGYNNYNKPTPINTYYKPGVTPGPGLVFPPVTMEPPLIINPVTSTSAPIGPPGPSGTIVPIIGGGGGNGGDGGGSGGGLPEPEDIFPPSPPEIESVGRSLNLRMSSPRTRISNVGPTKAPLSTSRESNSFRRSGANAASVRSGGSGVNGAPGRSGSSTTSSSNKRVRLRDKVRASVESVNDEVADGNELESDPNVITDFVFSDIKCFKTRSKEYFGATIHMKNGYHIPYVRDRPQDPLTSNECRMDKVPGSVDTFHMTVTDLRGCGVEQCGDYMCLTMVFPRVPTLALADDEVTTIKCLPQKSTMADTRTISFAGDSLENRRSSSTVEGGGQDFAAEVGVFRQNPGSDNGLYVKRVNSGGVVQLGEPLQLRSIVRGGDGWKHSRLSDVKVWRMRDAPPLGNLDNLDPNDASEVITLVDGQGCRNNEYQVIADSHPLKDPRNELVNHFTFKAFLFRGQRANEPLVLTAKVHACQEDMDCSPDACKSIDARSKRSPVEIRNASAIIHNYDSRMALRVVGLKDHSASLTEEDFPKEYSGQGRNASDAPLTCAEKMAAAGLGGSFIALFLCGLSLALYAYVIKGKALRRLKSVPFSAAFLENGNPPRRNPTIQRGQQQSLSSQSIRGKPLPPPPTCSSDINNGKEKLSKSEISNVAKLLQKLADTKTHEGQNAQDQTQYECIDESSTSGSLSSSDLNNNNTVLASSPTKKSDGVYIVYCCKDNKSSKGKRPKSAPPSLRDKKGSRKSRKKSNNNAIYDEPPTEDSVSGSQTEITEESEEDSNICSKSPSGRRTVRSVKSRSNHHVQNSSKHKVAISGIRRRLSSFYKDGRMQNFKTNIMSGGHGQVNIKSGSFPARQKMRSATTRGHPQMRRGELSDDIYSSTQMSSDLDSAYYGSEFNNEQATRYTFEQQQQQQMRRGQGRASGYNQYDELAHGIRMDSYNDDGNNRNLKTAGHVQKHHPQNDIVLNDIKMQLRNAAGKMGMGSGSRGPGVGVSPIPMGPKSPQLEPGQTKAAHFVTRCENSTQILIVPETHV